MDCWEDETKESLMFITKLCGLYRKYIEPEWMAVINWWLFIFWVFGIVHMHYTLSVVTELNILFFRQWYKWNMIGLEYTFKYKFYSPGEFWMIKQVN